MSMKRLSIIAVILVATVLVAGIGHSRGLLSTMAGAQTCGLCHADEFAAWQKSPHATAHTKLTRSNMRNKVCTSCHSLGDSPMMAGVQCESCHGAGAQYAKDFIMKDKKLSAAVGLVARPGKEVCLKCHGPGSPSIKPFDFEAGWARIGHGKAFKDAAAAADKPTGTHSN